MNTIRIEEAQRELTRRHLTRSKYAQAETVARHYVAHAILAKELLWIVQAIRNTGSTPETDAILDHMLDTIKRDHLADLGLRLEWNDSEQRTQ